MPQVQLNIIHTISISRFTAWSARIVTYDWRRITRRDDAGEFGKVDLGVTGARKVPRETLYRLFQRERDTRTCAYCHTGFEIAEENAERSVRKHFSLMVVGVGVRFSQIPL